MTRLLLTSLLCCLFSACAGVPPSAPDHVGRAVAAMGGAEALASIKSLQFKAVMRQWEPEQSYVAGGEMKFAAESRFEVLVDVTADAARIDWVRDLVYPTTRSFRFSEIVTPQAGYLAGIDSNTRVKQNLAANPPGHAMSGLRLVATQRELKRASPLLLLEMHNNRQRVTPRTDVVINEVRYPAVDVRIGEWLFTVLFDAVTGLPSRVRTLDYDNVNGDSSYDLVFADWRQYGTVRLPAARQYQFNGKTVGDIRVTELALDVPVDAARFAIPPAMLATAARPAAGRLHYQWALRRQIIGTLIDSDNSAYDEQAVASLKFTELAPGVQHQAAGSAHSLIVEMRDHLIVFDAPTTDWQSNWTIKAAQEKYPGKPIRYLVLTHHHMDHAGGVRAYAAAGATLVVGEGNGAHFRKLLAAPATLNPDLPATDLSRTPVMEVDGKRIFSDGQREVWAIVAETNTHAKGMMIGYVSDARIGWVTDLWAPGRDVIKDSLNAMQLAVVNTVQKAGISPLRFAGGHGGVASYPELAAKLRAAQ